MHSTIFLVSLLANASLLDTNWDAVMDSWNLQKSTSSGLLLEILPDVFRQHHTKTMITTTKEWDLNKDIPVAG